MYNVKQGWKPLCDFLGCRVPTGVAFPHENIKGEIAKDSLSATQYGRQCIREIKQLAGFVILSVVVAIVATIFVIMYF